jgi:hypothetical protein
MNYEQYMRALENPYWCEGSPLKWQADGIGLSHFALEGRVGLFNLCWLVTRRTTPPPAKVYRYTKLAWVIQLAGGLYVQGRSLEHHASILTLPEFKSMMCVYIKKVHPNPVDLVGGIPWATLYDLVIQKEPAGDG